MKAFAVGNPTAAYLVRNVGNPTRTESQLRFATQSVQPARGIIFISAPLAEGFGIFGTIPRTYQNLSRTCVEVRCDLPSEL